ncbi:MAG: hypothetical protein KAJ14_11535 [Candidatus Omnitrophica bacterium]|nr:hypothetical protein [Candidatus Omnitrophota bacterium]
MVDTKTFFNNCIILDHLVLRQLCHIKGNWELTWDGEKEEYESEENSYADLLNKLIEEMGNVNPPAKYHDNEDCLAEYVKERLNWNIKKINGCWVGLDYFSILEQGAFDDIDQDHLILAAVGRIKAAIKHKQLHFDEMEQSHQRMLADVLAIILYHRTYA